MIILFLIILGAPKHKYSRESLKKRRPEAWKVECHSDGGLLLVLRTQSCESH